jgi:hypothetical protein
MATFEGNNVNLDYGDLELTEELEEALCLLDDSCRGGSGGTYDIFETDEEGAEWEAVPCDGPYDTLYFVEGDWTEQLPDEEEEEYDEDEEHDAQSLGPDPDAY